MADRDDEERQERLIAALESQANAITRLVQVLEGKTEVRMKRQRQRAFPPSPRVIETNPIVSAAVDRALARVNAK
jgi:hypothetical protein